jgi:hypothetical protein
MSVHPSLVPAKTIDITKNALYIAVSSETRENSKTSVQTWLQVVKE